MEVVSTVWGLVTAPDEGRRVGVFVGEMALAEAEITGGPVVIVGLDYTEEGEEEEE